MNIIFLLINGIAFVASSPTSTPTPTPTPRNDDTCIATTTITEEVKVLTKTSSNGTVTIEKEIQKKCRAPQNTYTPKEPESITQTRTHHTSTTKTTNHQIFTTPIDITETKIIDHPTVTVVPKYITVRKFIVTDKKTTIPICTQTTTVSSGIMTVTEDSVSTQMVTTTLNGEEALIHKLYRAAKGSGKTISVTTVTEEDDDDEYHIVVNTSVEVITPTPTGRFNINFR